MDPLTTTVGAAIPKLKGTENWKPWRIAIRNYLKSKGLWEHVDGDVGGPEKEEDESPAEFKARLRQHTMRDAVALTVLVNNTIESIMVTLDDFLTAKEVYDYLSTNYEQSGIAHEMSLWQEFASLTFQPGDSIEKFCYKYKNLINQCQAIGLAIPSSIQSYQFVYLVSGHYTV